MPRPHLIARIHELKYRLRDPRIAVGDFIKTQQEYDAEILEACRQYGCAKVELLTALRIDFGRWVNQEGLPWYYETETES